MRALSRFERGERGLSLPAFLASLGLAIAAPVVGTISALHPAAAQAGAPVRSEGQVQASLPADIASGPDSLQLIGQSTWIGPGKGEFEMDLAISASDIGDETIAVDVYSELYTRSAFQAVLDGNFTSPYYQMNPPIALGQLRRGPNGGAELEIPVNSPAGQLDISSTGVYPVQVFLQKDGLTQGKPLTTFLVYAASGASSMQHLGVSVVVPFRGHVPVSQAGSVGELPASSAVNLENDASAVAASQAPVTLDASASTLEALAQAKGKERAAVADLASAVAAGDEVLPSTQLPVDMGSIVSSGLVSQLDQQVSAGDGELASLVGEAPDPGTWALPGKISGPVLQALSALGASDVVVPQAALSALPANFSSLTFAQPSKLDAGGTELEAIAADTELSQRIREASAPGQAALVANQVLAELAMIDLEVPNDRRGVVLMPPARDAINPTFLSVLLAGLEGNPLLRAVTLAQQFATVPLATTSGTQLLVRRLATSGTARPLAGASGLATAQGSVADVADVYGAGATFVQSLDRKLFVSTSSVWDSRQRARIIGGVSSSAHFELGKLRLPSPTSITLTSRHGHLPLTLLSGAGIRAHVRLVLSSEELSFVRVSFPSGTCVPVNAGSEQCRLDLVQPATTLQFPVAVRTPGAFQLSLEIETPNGTVVATSTDKIRSTAVSEVGLLLMVGAALFLAIWWVRNARHGRRARRLVPPPDGDGTTTGGMGADGAPSQPGVLGAGESARAGAGWPQV